MKLYSFLLVLLVCTLTLTSCEAIGTIFKAGMYWAFFLVALIVGIILWVVMKSRKK
jgi:hypothetical protein